MRCKEGGCRESSGPQSGGCGADVVSGTDRQIRCISRFRSLLDTLRPVSPASLVREKLILASQKPISLLSSPISKGHLSTYCWQIRNGI